MADRKDTLWQARLDEEQIVEAEYLFEQALTEGKAENKKDFQLKLFQLWKFNRLKEGKSLPTVDPVIVSKYSGDMSRLESLTSQIDKLYISLLEHFSYEHISTSMEFEGKVNELMKQIETLQLERGKAYEERKQAIEDKKISEAQKEKAISDREGMLQHVQDVERSVELERKTHEQAVNSFQKDLEHEQERSRQKDEQIANLYSELQESKSLIKENRAISDKLKEKDNRILSLKRDHEYDLKEKLLARETELRGEFNEKLAQERKEIRKEAKEEAWEVCNAKLENLKETHKTEMQTLKERFEDKLNEELKKVNDSHKAEIETLKQFYEKRS